MGVTKFKIRETYQQNKQSIQLVKTSTKYHNFIKIIYPHISTMKSSYSQRFFGKKCSILDTSRLIISKLSDDDSSVDLELNKQEILLEKT